MPRSADSHKKETLPTPPPEPEKVKLPETDAELEQRRADVVAAMWGPKPDKPVEKPVEAAPPAAPAAEEAPEGDPAPEPAEAVAEKEPEKPAPVEKPAAPPAPAAEAPPDHRDLIAQTAKKIGEEVGQAIRDAKPETEPEPAPDAEFIPEDVRDIEILTKMEEMNPDMKGLVGKFKKFALQRYDYESAWRDKNPGAQYNPDDAEHAEFYKGMPEFEQEYYDDAKDELRVDRKVAQRLKPIEERAEADHRRTKSEQAIAAHVPKIVENVKSLIIESVTAVNPEVAKLLETMNPLDLTKEEQEKLEDEDPITTRVMGPMVRDELIPMLWELEKSDAPGAEYEIDPRPRNNTREEKRRAAIHSNIAHYVAQFEDEAVAKAEKRDGRNFITLFEMSNRQREIEASKSSLDTKQRRLNELQARHWTTSVGDVKKTIVEIISKRAKAAVDEFDGIARRKYKPEPKKPAANSPATPPAPTPPQTPAANSKPRPPSVASQATVVDTSRAGQSGEKSFGETAVEVHWGR